MIPSYAEEGECNEHSYRNRDDTLGLGLSDRVAAAFDPAARSAGGDHRAYLTNHSAPNGNPAPAEQPSDHRRHE